jgi:hypothetical protein
MMTDNGIEYDSIRIEEFDETDALLTATEYLKEGEIVRRDVHAKLKSKVLAPIAEIKHG